MFVTQSATLQGTALKPQWLKPRLEDSERADLGQPLAALLPARIIGT